MTKHDKSAEILGVYKELRDGALADGVSADLLFSTAVSVVCPSYYWGTATGITAMQASHTQPLQGGGDTDEGES